jgi:hypothetical protein
VLVVLVLVVLTVAAVEVALWAGVAGAAALDFLAWSLIFRGTASALAFRPSVSPNAKNDDHHQLFLNGLTPVRRKASARNVSDRSSATSSHRLLFVRNFIAINHLASVKRLDAHYSPAHRITLFHRNSAS